MTRRLKSGVEGLAVGEIERFCSEPGVFLDPNITKGDKGVSFDGHITIYKDHRGSKSSYIAQVPVQVKGETVKKFSNLSARQKVSLKDLRIYRKNNGVIFIRGEILESENKIMLFYRNLLNLDLDKLLKTSNKTSVTIDMMPILNGNALRTICSRFNFQQSKQPDALIGKFTLKDAMKSSQLKLTSVTVSPSGDVSELLGSDFYIFAVENEVDYPVTVTKLESISRDSSWTIPIDDEPVTFSIKKEHRVNENKIVLEDALNIFIPTTGDKTSDKIRFKLEIEQVSSLTHYRKCLDFLSHFFGLSDEDVVDSPVKDNNTLSKDTIKDLREELYIFERLFDRIGIPLDYVLYPFREKGLLFDFRNQLEDIFMKDVYDELDFDEEGFRVSNLRFGESIIFILMINKDSKQNVYTPNESFFNKEIEVFFSGEEERSRVNLYLMQDPLKLLEPINVTFTQVLEAFNIENFSYNDITFSITNSFTIGLLNAYDTNQNEDYLFIAKEIFSNFIDSNIGDENKNIAIINLYQTIYRLNGKFSEQEIDFLLDLRDKNTQNHMINFCSNVLVGNRHDAKRVLEKIVGETRSTLETYPIYTLYKNLLH